MTDDRLDALAREAEAQSWYYLVACRRTLDHAEYDSDRDPADVGAYADLVDARIAWREAQDAYARAYMRLWAEPWPTTDPYAPEPDGPTSWTDAMEEARWQESVSRWT